VLFTLGQQLISLYLGQTSSSFGAADLVMILLLWVYYSCEILLLGTEFTRLYVTIATQPSLRTYSLNTPGALNHATPATDSTSSRQRVPPVSAGHDPSTLRCLLFHSIDDHDKCRRE
jgi:hypothetical protein